MRVADKMNYDQVNSNITRNRADMAELQNQASTQKRVNKPSDDPLAAARVLSARTEIAGNSQYMKSVNSAKSFLEFSEQSLGELADALIRAKELAVSQANDAGANKGSREVVANEVEQLRNQAVQISNRKLGDRFLFGGFRTTKPPFLPDGKYRGDDGEIEISVGKEAKVAMNVPGSRAFLGRDIRAERARATADPAAAEAPEVSGDLIPLEAGSDAEATARGPASVRPPESEATAPKADLAGGWASGGTNVFKVLRDFEIALRTNDKAGIQAALDDIDGAIAQTILVRSELGARVGSLNSGMESLQKGQVDTKTLASSLEDADTFELVSDLNKSESTLKATLQTSGKLIQSSLLDFLR